MKSSDRLLRLAFPLALALSACVAASNAGDGTGGSGAAGNAGTAGTADGTGGTTGAGQGGGPGTGAGGQTTTGAGGGAVITGGGGRVGVGGAGQGGTPGLGGMTMTVNPDGGSRPDLTGRKALFIVDNSTDLDDGDIFIQQLLEVRGMTVTYGTLATPASMAAGFNVLIISSGLGADAGPIFKDVPIPMVIFGNSNYQAMGFVPNSASRGNTSVGATITDTTTQLSSDLAMGANITIINPVLGNTQITWGIPGGTPIKVAAVMGAPTEFAVFGYEKGAAMSVGTAAARRVGIGWKSNAVRLLTVDAFKLQDGAFSWTAGAP